MNEVNVEIALKIIQGLASMPVAGIAVAVLILPWLILVYTGFRQERRFEAVVEMYKNNVSLVRDYQQLVEGYRKIVDGQQELVVYVTATLTGIQTRADSNLFCPITRENLRQETKR